MKRFVGLDVSQATTAICVVDSDGKTLAEGVTATEPDAIAAFLHRRAPDAERIGLETGPLSVWLWNELRALDLPVVCMDARHANAGLKVMLAKTDRNDAAGLAQLVRTGWFRQVHVKAESSHVVRAELATRTLLVRMRCDLENQIRGVLKTFGLVIGKAPSRLVKRAHEIVADELATKPELASLVESLLAMRASVVERIEALDGRLRVRAKTTPVCRRFITVPGIGPITALAIWASIDDQARFARSRDVGAYFGPGLHQVGGQRLQRLRAALARLAQRLGDRAALGDGGHHVSAAVLAEQLAVGDGARDGAHLLHGDVLAICALDRLAVGVTLDDAIASLVA